MDHAERRALANLRFDWAPTPAAVWAPPPAHVAELNAEVLDAVLGAYTDADVDPTTNPLGVAVTGQQGAGKTHLLGAVRVEVQRRGGYFFLISLVHGKNFWQNIVHSLRNGLYQSDTNGFSQLTSFLHRLSDALSLPDDVRRQVIGHEPVTKEALDRVVVALREASPTDGWQSRHTARALILLAAVDPAVQEIGEAYLTSGSESTPRERAEWGIHPDPKHPHEMVREITGLLGMTGASLLAIDQIDSLISKAGIGTRSTHESAFVLPRSELFDEIGTGLMELREAAHRSLLVVACQFPAWEAIRKFAHRAAVDRFREELRLRTVSTAETGQALVATRFAPRFKDCGFTPPYPTWPIRVEAFAGATQYTPRELFKRIDEHVKSCLDRDEVVELNALDQVVTERRIGDPPPRVSSLSDDQLRRLDRSFATLKDDVDPSPAVHKDTEDKRMTALLTAALTAYRHELGERGRDYEVEDVWGGRNPALHSRLKLVLDDKTEDAIHWSFRGIATDNSLAAKNRIERLRVISDLDPEVDKRRAYLLRTGPWSMESAGTKAQLTEFLAAGGVLVKHVDMDDLRTFAALELMLDRPGPELHEWLHLRKPASSTALFRLVFGPPEEENPPAPDSPVPEPVDATGQDWPTDDPDAVRQHPPAPLASISLGNRLETGEPVYVSLESLRKHTVIFAGSGSGKTVLIRRIVEECALQGVSAIVLDPNNDLARLGDAWPQPPTGWGPEDQDKASDYLANTDVVVWTPRREAGRPVSFQPLPDFADVLGDPDEFTLALDIAVAALAPRARADGSTAKAERTKAVLREALTSFAQAGGSGLRSFLDYLSDLPEEVTRLANATAIAGDVAQTLLAAMINDPLFGGSGVPLDPGVLLTPAPGKRARISVISMIGLPNDDQRRSFVNQLQMAMFAWIKANPAGDRPLGGLFVMDEAQTLAPSGSMTACTTSTLALASQARKYGLGLVFATQAPKGIHNQIVGNAATQYFGFINSPVQVAAAKEMAAAKSSAVLDISRLSAGEFYAVAEGKPFQKVRSPMCLSHHPSSALTAEEVLTRARTD
ncbi:MAG: ATP-binding protein [Saccharothrix sp.]|nr:ATP-binding protein [Saccharothrix sp.]